MNFGSLAAWQSVGQPFAIFLFSTRTHPCRITHLHVVSILLPIIVQYSHSTILVVPPHTSLESTTATHLSRRHTRQPSLTSGYHGRAGGGSDAATSTTYQMAMGVAIDTTALSRQPMAVVDSPIGRRRRAPPKSLCTRSRKCSGRQSSTRRRRGWRRTRDVTREMVLLIRIDEQSTHSSSSVAGLMLPSLPFATPLLGSGSSEVDRIETQNFVGHLLPEDSFLFIQVWVCSFAPTPSQYARSARGDILDHASPSIFSHVQFAEHLCYFLAFVSFLFLFNLKLISN